MEDSVCVTWIAQILIKHYCNYIKNQGTIQIIYWDQMLKQLKLIKIFLIALNLLTDLVRKKQKSLRSNLILMMGERKARKNQH